MHCNKNYTTVLVKINLTTTNLLQNMIRCEYLLPKYVNIFANGICGLCLSKRGTSFTLEDNSEQRKICKFLVGK
jgi:hypothetical protein